MNVTKIDLRQNQDKGAFSKARSAAHFNWAEKQAFQLTCLPEHVRPIAAATCRFILRGKIMNGGEKTWGMGFRTEIQTYGEIPQVMGRGTPAATQHGEWLSLYSQDAADMILSCFGLSADDILDRCGKPQFDECIIIDLKDIVEAAAVAQPLAA